MDLTSHIINSGVINMDFSPNHANRNNSSTMKTEPHQTLDIKDVIKTEPQFGMDVNNEDKIQIKTHPFLDIDSFDIDTEAHSVMDDSKETSSGLLPLQVGEFNKEIHPLSWLHSDDKVNGVIQDNESNIQEDVHVQSQEDQIFYDNRRSQFQPFDGNNLTVKAESQFLQNDYVTNDNYIKTEFQPEQDHVFEAERHSQSHFESNREMEPEFQQMLDNPRLLEINDIRIKTEPVSQDDVEVKKEIAFTSQQDDRINIVAEQTKSKPFDVTTDSKSGDQTANCIKCIMCDKTFYDKSNLRRHFQNIHEKGVGVSCKICNKRFNEKRSLKNHIQVVHTKVNNLSSDTHDEQKPFSCKVCCKSFARKKSLRRHEMSHTDTYKCDQCQQQFNSRQHLDRHVNGVHKKLRPFSCPDCDKSFLTKRDVDRHADAVHKKLKRYKCMHCDKSYSGKPDLIRHVDVVHKELMPYSCTDCGQACVSKRDLNLHIDIVHKPMKTFKCGECDRSYAVEQELLRHVVVVHNKQKSNYTKMTEEVKSEQDNEETHSESKDDFKQVVPQMADINDFKIKSEPPCVHVVGEIKTEFKSEKDNESPGESYSQGYSETKDENKHELPQLLNINGFKIKTEPIPQEEEDVDVKIGFTSQEGDSFKIKVEENELLESNSSALPTASKSVDEPGTRKTCTMCDKTFSDNDNLRIHVRNVHEKVSGPTCHVCGKSFYDKRNLRKHVQSVHEKVKKWSCPICAQTFYRKKTCDNHIGAVHNKLTPHSCKFCSKSFFRLESLKAHELSHTNENPFQCPECQQHFSQKHHLDRHIDGVHKKLRPFPCDSCDKAFLTKRDLDRHVDAVHKKIKPHKCIECDRSFAAKPDLLKHVDVVHRNLKAYCCTMCDKSFSKRADRDQHINSVHLNLKSFTCSVCQKAFRSHNYLKKHEKLHEKYKPCEPNSLIGEYVQGDM